MKIRHRLANGDAGLQICVVEEFREPRCLWSGCGAKGAKRSGAGGSEAGSGIRQTINEERDAKFRFLMDSAEGSRGVATAVCVRRTEDLCEEWKCHGSSFGFDAVGVDGICQRTDQVASLRIF
jgi:hypothetical protein